ncbi:acyl-CoA oxidase [Heterostelium album PN500]|uniref:Acyl-coenzyme A oxidase n=1 Tax=Heterostelium pallidum (strain ATCC 26659 / Pp 5 / PN500) TaxID=670386 RepID=D3B2D3_HETP5|nr:acyl-CoA oxidase [Heterostelium album PN500]EFA84508.1 acyl-CoA oxidase [Heterostelium album PN500]|eukprot:XP_020436621.1 acyl-CoA oxidase [Heterostelium album PN500]
MSNTLTNNPSAASSIEKPFGSVGIKAVEQNIMMNQFPMDRISGSLLSSSGKTKGTNTTLSDKLYAWSTINTEHQELRRTALDLFTDKSVFQPSSTETKERQRVIVLNQLQYFLSKTFGKGLINISDLRNDPSKICALMDCASQFDDNSFMTKMVVNNFLFGAAVFNLGTEKHHRLLPDIQSGKLLGCFAMTELGHGSNVRSLETTATYIPETNEFVIQTPKRTATKWWIGNAGHAVMASVFARLIVNGEDQEVHCFLVPIRQPNGVDLMPGVRIGDCGPKFGMNGVDNGWIQFESVRIPYDNLYDKYGSIVNGVYQSPIANPSRRFANILAQMITGRISISYGCARTLKVALTIAVRYSNKRVQFGATPTAPETPIIEYPTHYTVLMPMIATVYAFDAIKSYLCKRFCERSDEGEIHVLASGLKATISHYVTTSILELRRLCGGHGYSSYSRFSSLIASNDVARTFEGDNTLLYQQVAKDLLIQFKKEYSSNKFTGTLKYLGKNTSLLLSEHTYTTYRSDKDHLLNLQFLRSCMEYRSSKLLIDSANTVSKAYKVSKDAFDSWNQSLETLIHLAKSHTEMMIVSKFIDSVKNVQDKETRETLKKLCQLYALKCIREDMEFFRNTNYLKKNKAKAISKLISSLCHDLSKQSLELVAGYGNEEALIESPLGQLDGDLYENICAKVGLFSKDNYPQHILDAKL